MHNLETPRRYRRAERLDVRQHRAERQAAASLAQHLEAWHERAVKLAAIGNHRLLRGMETDAVREDAERLVAVVLAKIDEWRGGLGDTQITGAVLDAERSCRSIIATLDALLGRLRAN